MILVITREANDMRMTRDKLDEAQYFLNKMDEIQNGPNPGSWRMVNAFRYNLNAYLAAARSIIFVMKKEFGGKKERGKKD
jgi:hypothetical protein